MTGKTPPAAPAPDELPKGIEALEALLAQTTDPEERKDIELHLDMAKLDEEISSIEADANKLLREVSSGMDTVMDATLEYISAEKDVLSAVRDTLKKVAQPIE